MNITKATITDLQSVYTIVRNTIAAVYPRYYPAGAVEFFINHHSEEKIAADIDEGKVYLLLTLDNEAAGTVTVTENELCRLFVLPFHQKKGYGRALMAYAEQLISKHHSCIRLDASLPAKSMYLKMGYVPAEYHCIETASGDVLCYDVMQKSLR